MLARFVPAVFVFGLGIAASSLSIANAQEASANELAKEVVTHEIQAQDADHAHWQYHLETMKSGKKETREVIETKDGELKKLIAINGQPLTPDQQKDEEARIQKLISDPSEQRKLQQASKEDSEKTKQLFKMIPEAFLFSYGEKDGDKVTLNFKPNPNFHPPTREARVLHEMEGHILVDSKQKRLVEISGRLLNEVKFGGGLLGHLDPGGTFDVKQIEVAPNHWQISVMDVEMKGKALFFKTIAVQEKELHTQFQPVPDSLTLAQAEDLLKKKPAQATP